MNEELSRKQRHELINEYIEMRLFQEQIFVYYEDDKFTKDGYFKCCDKFNEFLLSHDLTMNEKKDFIQDYEILKSLANYKDSWKRIEHLFYNWILRNIVVFPTLAKTTTLTQESFLQLFKEAIVEWNNENDDDENKEQSLQFLNQLFKLLSNENIFLKVKERYLEGLFKGPLLTEVAAISTKIESEYLIKNLRQIIERDNDGTSDIGEEEKTLLCQQLTYPDTLKSYKKYLAIQEQKGYIVYLTFCKVMKDITMSKFRQLICIHKYITKQNYPMTEEGLGDLIQSFDFLAPNKIIYLYYYNHLECLNSIVALIDSCIPSLFSEDEKTKKILVDICIQSEDYVNKNGATLFNTLSDEFLAPRYRKLDLLSRKLIQTCEVYNKSKKKDKARLALGVVTGSFLFSTLRMAKRDLSLPSKVKNDFDNILAFYNNYLRDLEKYEAFLIQQYEKIFDKWFEFSIRPIAKKIFRDDHPVRYFYGLSNFENLLKQEILEHKNKSNEVTPVTDKNYKPYLDSKAFKTYKIK